MNRTVLVLSNHDGVSARWQAMLAEYDLAVERRATNEPRARVSAVACVLDADSYDDDDALLVAAALASAEGLPVAIDLGRSTGCDALVVEIASGRVAASPADVREIAQRLVRCTVDVDDPRLELVTLGPDGASLLAVLSSGASRLEPRPLHADDDGAPIASITLVDDGLRAEIVTSSGAAFFWSVAPRDGLDGASVGRRVRELRAKAGITQAELARRTGIHRPNIARVEAGKHMPSLETVARLAEALGTSPARILEGTH